MLLNEDLLLPLVSAASLPEHPSLSIAYSSPILTNMAQHACEMVQKEKKTLANAKRMATKLRGDETWLPCEVMYSEKDEAIFNTEKLYKRVTSCNPIRKTGSLTTRSVFQGGTKGERLSESRDYSATAAEFGLSGGVIRHMHKESAMEHKSNGERVTTNDAVSAEGIKNEGAMNNTIEDTHEEMDIVSTEISPRTASQDGEKTSAMVIDEDTIIVGPTGLMSDEHQRKEALQEEPTASVGEDSRLDRDNSPSAVQPGTNSDAEIGTALANENAPKYHLPTPDADEPENEMSQEGLEGENGGRAAPRRMRTRAQAQAVSDVPASSRNGSPESWTPSEIHTLFKIPERAIADKNFGLPSNEADETRRLFTMYVQKQEEVCRGAEKLYHGLLRADRQRKETLNWCKAEGHVGEMSDGEDWYDKGEWGLEADLAKGQDEDDGDPNPIQGKKTRGRRV